MRRSLAPFALPLVLATALGGCSTTSTSTGDDASAASPDGGGQSLTTPTFHKDVERILQNHCLDCHSPGRIAPFSLVTYRDALNAAIPMVAQAKSGAMPPWGAEDTAECKPRHSWRDDKRLSAGEIATLEAWVKGGSPEGDLKDAPPTYQLPPEGLPGMSMQMAPQNAYVSSGSRDQFRCFVIDPKFAETKYLNGWNLVAGNDRVVHHVLLFSDEKRESLAKMDATGGYDCFGGIGLSSTKLIGAWAPGAVPAEYPPDVATHIPANTLLVMQVHYHPSGMTHDPDSTQLQMRFLDQAPAWKLDMALIGNFAGYDAATGNGIQPTRDNPSPKFMIPANVKDHVIDQKFTLPAMIGGFPLPELRLLLVGTHMHYVGRDMQISIERAAPTQADPKDECFVQTPNWDFNWQRGYMFNAPMDQLPTVKAGDKLRMRCTYDNTMGNPFVVEALRQEGRMAPAEVNLGEMTLDEMCLGVFGFAYKVK